MTTGTDTEAAAREAAAAGTLHHVDINGTAYYRNTAGEIVARRTAYGQWRQTMTAPTR